MGIFEAAGTSIDGAVDAFVTTASSNVIAGIAGLILAGVTLYITIYGYMVMFGKVQEPLTDFFIKAAKIVLIIVFALGTGVYQGNIVDGFRGLESGLSTMVNGSSASNIYQALDNSFSSGMDLTVKAFGYANQSNLLTSFGTCAGWYSSGIIVGIGTLLITVYAVGYIFLAKIALALLFAIGPIFIMCLLFPPVRRFFDAWAAQVITFILVIVLLATAMAFALQIFNGVVSTANFDAAATTGGPNMIKLAFEILAITLGLLIVIYQIPTIAAGLGGGFGLSMLNPLAPAMMAARGMKNIINPNRTRRDMKTGHMETASRAQHLRSGNTVLNPAYSRRLYDNMRNGWGRGNK